MSEYRTVQYQCRYCGRIETRSITSGRPSPGTCPRRGKTRDGRTYPHSWQVHKKW